MLNNKKELIAILFIMLVTFLCQYPLIKSIKKISMDEDFLQYASRHLSFRKSIIEYHQFPLRSHYFGGGYPTIAEPEDPSLSPFVTLTLIFGEVVGLKLIAIAIYMIGTISMFFLCRRVLFYNIEGALFSTLSFSLASWFHMRVFGGNFNELYYFFVPLMFYLFEKYNTDKKYFFPLVLLLTIVLMDGKLVFFSIILFFFLYVILRSVEFKYRKIDIKPIFFKKILVITLFVVLLGAIKIFSVLGLFSESGNVLFPSTVFHSSYSQTVYIHNISHLLECFYGTTDSPMHIGIMPSILFLVSMVVCFKRFYKCFVLLLISLMLIMSSNFPIDLFKVIKQLPFLNIMNNSFKYFNFFVIFIITIISGALFNYLEKYNKKKYIIFVVLCMFNFAVPFLFSHKINKNAFTVEKSELPIQKEFFNIKPNYTKIDKNMYFNLLQNVGTIYWYWPVKEYDNVMPKYIMQYKKGNIELLMNKEYNGEYYFKNRENSAEVVKFSPNVLEYKVRLSIPDKLIINQNYSKYWKSDKGNILNYNGLICLNLTEIGEYSVKLKYVPLDFYYGLIISMVSFIIFISMFIYKKRADKKCFLSEKTTGFN